MSPTEPEEPTPTWDGPMPEWTSEPPRVDVVPCGVCAATPTERFNFFQQVGVYRLHEAKKTEGYWCRTCALSIGRRVQTRTIFTGWAGYGSLGPNMTNIGENPSELKAVAKMDEAEPNERTLKPGPPVVARVAVALAIIAIVFVILWTLLA